jgi:hypothetical protein
MHKGYKCLHVPLNWVYISRDVVFYEGQFSFATTPNSPPTPILEHILLSTLHATIPHDQHVVRTTLPIMHHGSNPGPTSLGSVDSRVPEHAIDSHVHASVIDPSVPASPVQYNVVSDQLQHPSSASMHGSPVPDQE